jgi:hypothetical protein
MEKGKTTIKRTLIRLGLAAMLPILALSTVAAQGPAPSTAPGVTEPAAPAGADDGALEIGVEWVVDYPPGWNDLPATAPDALGLYNRLGGCGWTRRFAWGNGGAWEQDWKGQWKAGGGTEQIWIDTVDLAYFAGHGNSEGFFFGVGGNTIDDGQLRFSDCTSEWGTTDAEWVGIAACNVLADAHLGDWAWCMNHLHLILGFVTTMADVPHGDWFGAYICAGYNMTQAWFRAADALQPQNKIARVLAEEQYHFYDRWWNHIGGDWFDNDYYWWDHRVGSEPARYVNTAALNGVMPVFQTPPLSLGEANEKWANLGAAFGVTTTGKAGQPLTMRPVGAEPVRMSQDGQLEMGEGSGMYAFTNLQTLWATPTVALANAPVRRLTPEDAHQIADQFLQQNGLMPGDAQFFEVVTDTLVTAPSKGQGVNGMKAAGTLQEQTTSYQVIYSRIVSATLPGVGNAPGATQEFSVVGPGAKLKVYVAPAVAAGLSPQAAMAQAVIGGVGGWRGAGQVGNAPEIVQTVPILDYAQIVKLLDALEPTVALSFIPLDYTSRSILTHTVGYYENPIGVGQDQLIPVYVMDVRSVLPNQDVVTSAVHIPANPTFMAPLALISPTAGLPTSVRAGQQVTFRAADASQTLSSLGYDASLSFVLGMGDPDSYTYAWYRDSIAPANLLGNGPTLNYTVTLGANAHVENGPVGQTIILQVTDLLSPRTNNTSIATYQMLVTVPRARAPIVIK